MVCLNFLFVNPQVFGRHTASDRLVSGAYKTEYGDQDELDAVSDKVRRPVLFSDTFTQIF